MTRFVGFDNDVDTFSNYFDLRFAFSKTSLTQAANEKDEEGRTSLFFSSFKKSKTGNDSCHVYTALRTGKE